MPTIALSAGHQPGKDNGAVYKNLLESQLTVKITDRATDLLRANGVAVLRVPDNLDLVQTIKWINDRANLNDIVLCIEIHINAGNGTGVEVWDYAGEGNQSDRLADFLVDALAVESGLKNRGTKDETTNNHGRLGFVHDTIPVAALAECGFIDGDYNYLKVDNNLTKLAKGIARGTLGYLGLPWKPNGNQQPIPQPTPIPPVNDPKDKIINELNDNLVKLQTKINNAKVNLTEAQKDLA